MQINDVELNFVNSFFFRMLFFRVVINAVKQKKQYQLTKNEQRVFNK